MKNIIEIPTAPGRPERRGITLPLRGPFVILGQNERPPEGITWNDFLFSNPAKASPEFDLQLGSVVYQNDGNNRIEMAGFYYDTSD